jgi:hypothetical protein
MHRKTIKEILMSRDGMSENEAQNLIRDAKIALEESISNGDPDYDICMNWFGLEPDYIYELLYIGI